MNDFFEQPPELKLGKYKHYKNKHYQVVGIARHSETGEWLVVYKPLYIKEERMAVRPYGMFTEAVVVNGVTKPRFEYISEM